MDVDKQETMEETILVGDDLMRGPPSPVIPKEIASHVLEDVELCDGILKNLFLCLQINDIEPFCQDEIVLYRQCAEKRDKEIRERMQNSEYKLGFSMPLKQAKERATQLQSEVTLLERRMILASGLEGMEGFRQRWSLHGQLEDTRYACAAIVLYRNPVQEYLASHLACKEKTNRKKATKEICLPSATRKRLEALNHGMEKRENQSSTAERTKSPAGKKWFFW
ncbi:late embryogenesis abundant protein-related / LEA protein-related [Zea mays]|uniref:Late embryogenesis abundant protein-related / LEA protein-related n=1 Tax=Zea mays TaxID=4577 RepID=A0A1D6EBN5_MAIZE|nr:late embryogenesis abundant protein-related / LEA protein-related [Zea mays]ONM17753.1 late embryogenesis abundant protein-related / LEA protein-related [Zea mays]